MCTEMTEGQRAAEDYKATLSELKSNSKPDIDALTMIAEENKEHAYEIATCIENQLKIVPNSRKLPVLYLIDSICKNYPKSIYVQLFTQNIVSNFCKVFEVSDERVRKSLHKLRMTWNEKTKIFPQSKLNAIDERVHEMDPNWPVLHKILSKQQIKQDKQPQQQQQQPQQQQQQIQQPPQQQSQQQQQQQSQQQSQQAQPMQPNSGGSNPMTGNKRHNSNQSNGRKKRSKNRHASQPSEPARVLPPQTLIDPNIIQASLDLQVHPTTYMDPSITMAPNDQLHPVPAATAYLSHSDIIMATHESQLPPANQLLCTPFNSTQSQPQQILPDLQPSHLSVLDSLYGGKQCSNCSLRFDDNNRYAIHLDWHYRQNKFKSDNMFARRTWYNPLDLWVKHRDIDDDEQQENQIADNNNANDLLFASDDHDPTAPAPKDDEKNKCPVCHETFEKFWADEEEEWRLRNAKLFDDDKIYHPLCLKDMLQANAAENSEQS